jgi:predicted RNA-binding protein YlqC (UPF0109 family)
MTPQDTLQKIIQAITQPDFKDKIMVTQAESVLTEITELNISAPQEIIGQIIGKQGKIIKSLRILMAIAFPNQRFNIQIQENL